MIGLRTVGLAVLVAVLSVGAGVGAYGITGAVRGDEVTATETAAVPTPSALAAAGSSPSAAPRSASPAPASPAAVAARLVAPLRAAALGGRVRAEVIDASSGDVLYDRGGSVAAPPASTAKILTAAAVLTVHQPTDRITTTVRAGSPGTVVLVGGGDPTLTGATKPADAAYAESARISDLARQVRAARVSVRRIVVDDSVFSGPVVSPAWADEDVPSEYGAAITAVMSDGGRAQPADTIRSAAPDLAAGQELAAALGASGVPVTRGTATSGRTLATVRSAPYSVLIEQMLLDSDNVIAECLARQVAVATGNTASFSGAARAVRTVLGQLGVRIGTGLVDGSGLADRDRVTPAVLADVLRLATGSTRPRLHTMLAGLPVAAWSGTLAGRYLRGTRRSGAGVVRAKTGTLTGVSALAGVVHDRSGRLLVFAFIADRAGATLDAETALDAVVTRLVTCGCD